MTPSQEDTSGSNEQQAQSATTSPQLPVPGISGSWDKLPEYQLGLVSDDSDTYLVNQLPESRSTPSSSDKASLHRTRSSTGSSPVKKSVTMKKAGQSSQAKRKRRGFLADELQKVNAVRQESACIRCQILKEPCGEGCPCPKCLDVNATATIWRSPCFKGRISDVQVYRNRCMSFPDGLRRIDQWASARKLKVQLYHVGFSGVNHAPETRPRIEIVVQNFVPVPEDVLHKKWVRGNEIVTFDMPAYAIPPKQKKRALQALEACFNLYWDVLVSEFNLGQDELVSAALDEGKRIHEQSSLLHAALSICAITRLISKSFNLTGQETLGITEVDDPVSPYYGRIPIPMFLDTQLDELWETLMGKISKKLLSELKRKILGRKKEDWYEVCLCLIILLANLELVYAAWLGQKDRYHHNVSNSTTTLFCTCLCSWPCSSLIHDQTSEASIPFSIRSTFKSWEHAADNILAHFRAVFNGNAPFFLDLEDKDLRAEAKLDDEAIAYLKRTKEILKSRGNTQTYLITLDKD